MGKNMKKKMMRAMTCAEELSNECPGSGTLPETSNNVIDLSEQCQAVEEGITPPICPYTTGFITVNVGLEDNQKKFFVHSGILSQSAELSDRLGWNCITLSDTDHTTFELVLRYLYSGVYEDYSSSTIPSSIIGHQSKALTLETHSLLYCFACLYRLEGLVGRTIENIDIMGRVPYVNVLDTAKKVYHRLPEEDTWYREWFKSETRNAMKENVHLVQEPWVLSTVREESGLLIVDLFTTLTEEARSEDAAQDLMPDGVLTPTISTIDHSPCEFRNKHLVSLKGSGPWKDCSKRHQERDQMMTTGRAIMSVVFTDLWPTFSQDLSRIQDISSSPTQKKKNRKKVRRALKEALCNLPVDSVTRAILEGGGDGQCPNQVEHLNKQDGKWLWESCSRCLHDRQLILKKLQELGIGEGFCALFGLVPIDGSSAEQAAPSPPEDEDLPIGATKPVTEQDFVTAGTFEGDVIIIDEDPRVKDYVHDEAEAKAVPEMAVCAREAEGRFSSVPAESWQQIIVEDRWSPSCSSWNRKDKNKNKWKGLFQEFLAEEVLAEAAPTEEAPTEEAPTEEAPTEDAPAEEAVAPAHFPMEYAEEAQFAEQEPPAPEEAPVADPESTALEDNTWGFPMLGLPKSNKNKKKLGKISWESPWPEPAEADPPPPPAAEEEPPCEPPAEEAPIEYSRAEVEAPAEDPPPPEEPALAEETVTRFGFSCQRRQQHFADESRWMQCATCRREMTRYARQLVGRG